jgi:gliding motility-associated-like protein
VVRLSLTLNPKPEFNLPEKIDFCKGKSVTLDAGSGYSSYLWNTGATTQTITVSTPGNYSVMVTNSFGCQNTDNIQVSYTILPEIVSVTVSNNSATVFLSATGSFEYSLDNFTWQDSNIFTNLSIGEYIVYVRTKGGCIIGQKPFSIFNIPNAFTPNGDGFNDRWKIAGLENYPGTEVNVYDRKGLPVFKEIITKKPMEWDGKLNGSTVPTGNYWYTIKVSDGRTYTGWLLIKNRN